MRGADGYTEAMCTMAKLDDFVPADHPLRPIRVWSPQQIAAKLRTMHPDDTDQRVCHETIYAAIYAHPRGGLKQAIEALHREKPARGRRRTSIAQSGFVPEQL
ncbi:MAG TPA: hypothetical protein VNZ04_07480, partial [Trinickia sp.]|nr:hypothetical protein [Trinickia sp.]